MNTPKLHNYSTMFWTNQIAEAISRADTDWNVVTEMASGLKEMALEDFEVHYFIQNCGYTEITEGDNPIAVFNYGEKQYMKAD